MKAARRSGDRWYQSKWPWVTATAALLGWILLNGVAALGNLERLPSAAEQALARFQTWYYDDVQWTGVWSTKAEGYIDAVEISAVDVRVELVATQGIIDGTIASPMLCKAFPLWNFVMLEGQVRGGGVEAVAYDYIRGQRTNFFTVRLERNSDATMIVIPKEGDTDLLPGRAKIRQHPDEKPMEYKRGAPMYCKEEREELMRQFANRPPSDGKRHRIN